MNDTPHNGNGNPFPRPGPGRPKDNGPKLSASARRVKRLRRELLAAVTPEDVRAIVEKLVAAARLGDLAAAKILLDRLFGPSEAIDLEERLAKIEAALSEDQR